MLVCLRCRTVPSAVVHPATVIQTKRGTRHMVRKVNRQDLDNMLVRFKSLQDKEFLLIKGSLAEGEASTLFDVVSEDINTDLNFVVYKYGLNIQKHNADQQITHNDYWYLQDIRDSNDESKIVGCFYSKCRELQVI